MVVLGVEERLRTGELRLVGLQERGDRALPVELAKMHADELVALDVLDEHRGILLVERLLPELDAVPLPSNRAGLHLLGRLELLARGCVAPALEVVVARDEDLLHLGAVRTLPAGEHPAPCVANGEELVGEPAVRHVARYQHGVDLDVPEVPERLLEHVDRHAVLARAVLVNYVYVGKYADAQPRRPSVLPEHGVAQPRRHEKRGTTAHEIPSSALHFHLCLLFRELLFDIYCW